MYFSGKFDGKPVEYKGEECQIIRDDNVLLAYNGLTLRLDNVECIRDAVLIALFDEEVVEKENDDVETNTPDNDKQQQSKQQKSPGIATTSSGVVIAASVLKDDLPCQGRVVRVGPGRVSCTTGLSTPGPVQAGDRVKFKEYAGNDIFIQGKPYTVVKMVDILATILPEAADW